MAYDLSSLHDGTAGAALSVVGTVTNAGTEPVGMMLTRDKLIALSQCGSGFYYHAADALDGSTATVWDKHDRFAVAPLGSGTVFGNFPASGNWLYSGFYDNFRINDLTPVWAGTGGATAFSVLSVPAWGTNAVLGGQAFLNDGSAIRSLDLSDISSWWTREG